MLTIEEAMKSKKLMRLFPFRGYQPCGKLTGRYYYNTSLDKEDPKDIMVEIKSGFLGLSREFVYLSNLREVKEVK